MIISRDITIELTPFYLLRYFRQIDYLYWKVDLYNCSIIERFSQKVILVYSVKCDI